MIATKNLAKNIIKQLKTQDLVRIPASEENYFSVAYDLPFKVEYHDSEIITMGLASFWHEALAATFIGILYKLLSENDEFVVLGSNSGVQIPKFEGGYYMPDVVVVKGEPIFKKNSTAIITNPYIVVEVLSPSTKKFDIEEKLPEYKNYLESLKQIIYVSQKKIQISSYTRSENPNIWLNHELFMENDEILIENVPVKLKEIYKKIKLPKRNSSFSMTKSHAE